MKTVITIEQNNNTLPSTTSLQSEAKQFDFMGHQVRIIMIDGNPWFVATDVCKSIGLTSPTKAVKSLDTDEVQVIDLDTLNSIQGNMNQTLRDMAASGVRKVNLISESGMYTLVLRCREAVKEGTLPHKFKRWVTSEVLPSIRKTGSYQHGIQPERNTISGTQVTHLKNRMQQATFFMIRAKASYSRLYDFIKFLYCLDNLEDMGKEDYDEALEQVEAIRGDNQEIKSFLFDLETELSNKHVYGNAPMTGKLRGRYKDELIGRRFGDPIDWPALAGRMYLEQHAKA